MIDYDDLLDANEDDDYGDQFDPTADPPELADLDALDEMLRRVSRIQANEARLNDAAKRRIEEIQQRRDDLLSGLARKRDWYERSIAGFAQEHFSRQPDKIRTVKVLHGDIKRRPVKAKVADAPVSVIEGLAEAWPQFVRRPDPEIAKTVVAKECEPGELVWSVPGPDGQALHQAVVVAVDEATGEITRTPVPGLMLLVANADKITWATR